MGLIIGCFVFGCAPLTIWYHAFTRSSTMDCASLATFHVTHTAAMAFLRLSETLNPLIYLFGGGRLREESKRLLRVQSPPKEIRFSTSTATKMSTISNA